MHKLAVSTLSWRDFLYMAITAIGSKWVSEVGRVQWEFFLSKVSPTALSCCSEVEADFRPAIWTLGVWLWGTWSSIEGPQMSVHFLLDSSGVSISSQGRGNVVARLEGVEEGKGGGCEGSSGSSLHPFWSKALTQVLSSYSHSWIQSVFSPGSPGRILRAFWGLWEETRLALLGVERMGECILSYSVFHKTSVFSSTSHSHLYHSWNLQFQSLYNVLLSQITGFLLSSLL